VLFATAAGCTWILDHLRLPQSIKNTLAGLDARHQSRINDLSIPESTQNGF